MKIRITNNYYGACFFKTGEIVTIDDNLKVKGSIYGKYKHICETKEELIKRLKVRYDFEEVKDMEFTKDDLKLFDVLVFERGHMAMVVSVLEEKELSWLDGGGDSINILSEKDNDINRLIITHGKVVKIFRPKHRGRLGIFFEDYNTDCLELIWEREEKSQAQIQIEELKKERDEFNKKMDERLAKLENELK